MAPEFDGLGGRYLSDCNEAPTTPDDGDPLADGNAVRAWAKDPPQARRLWDVSARLLLA